MGSETSKAAPGPLSPVDAGATARTSQEAAPGPAAIGHGKAPPRPGTMPHAENRRIAKAGSSKSHLFGPLRRTANSVIDNDRRCQAASEAKKRKEVDAEERKMEQVVSDANRKRLAKRW